MFLLYQFIILILLILSPFIIIFRILNDKEDKKRFLEKFSFSSKERKKGKLIWFHGASVGEILSILPLIKIYENNKYIDQILVTSNTLSSSRILKKFQFIKSVLSNFNKSEGKIFPYATTITRSGFNFLMRLTSFSPKLLGHLTGISNFLEKS